MSGFDNVIKDAGALSYWLPLAGCQTPTPDRFKCDGRTYCSQMTSCKEVKWTPLSRQFITEFKRVLSLLQLTGAAPILLNKLLLLRRRHVDIPSCVLRRNVVKG
jgi:hypothetical protein